MKNIFVHRLFVAFWSVFCYTCFSRIKEKGSVTVTEKERAALCVQALKKEYPQALCSLEAETPFRLLVATRLSAQCTDARVNLVTPALFEKYPDASAMSKADVHDVEELIHSCGFFRAKAKDIVEASKKIMSDFSGEVPGTMEELLTLPGVGRKTANLVLGDVFKKPAVVADTHLIRISNLLGFVSSKDPVKVEKRMREVLPPEESNDFCHRAVLHGRAVCVARRPNCAVCCMKKWCSYAQKESDKKDEKN